jgi:hypothetical protein
VNCAVDPAAAQEAFVGRVDDGVDFQMGRVAAEHRHEMVQVPLNRLYQKNRSDDIDP